MHVCVETGPPLTLTLIELMTLPGNDFKDVFPLKKLTEVITLIPTLNDLLLALT